MTGTGGTQGSGGTSGGTRASSAQSSGGQSSGGARSSSTQSSGGQSSGGARSSGTQSSGGQSSGGARSSSTQSSGGSTGNTSVSTGNPGTVGPSKTCGCLTSSGNYSGNPLTATIVVDAGENYDGGCKTYTTKSLASGGLGDGSQEENQKPLFRVNGGKLMNVILGAPAADGVHFYGNATAQNIHWLDIGEDASTIKANATVTMDCGSAKNGSDKVFQVNAKATWTISNFTIKGAGKGMRENGGECYPVNVVFDHCDISSLDEVIFRTDCSSSKITISNTRYSGLGDGLVMVGDKIYNSSSGNVTITNVQKY
jgi:pectate lyase C